MKYKNFFALLLLVMLTIGCNKDDTSFKSSAKILGQDMTLCACCGDWLLEIDTTLYEFKSLPENSNFDIQNTEFPVSVKITWRFDENSSCSNHIIIEQIEVN